MYTIAQTTIRACARARMAADNVANDSLALWHARRIEPATAIARTRAVQLLAERVHELAGLATELRAPDWLEQLQAATAGAVALAQLVHAEVLRCEVRRHA